MTETIGSESYQIGVQVLGLSIRRFIVAVLAARLVMFLDQGGVFFREDIDWEDLVCKVDPMSRTVFPLI